MKISENILNILGNCSIESDVVFLPPNQLDRKTYADVNKCLESIGGKWNRKAKGHVFSSDAADLIDSLILTREINDIKKQFQYFPTPPELAIQIVELADLSPEHTILEPSAGQGAIVDEIIRVVPGAKLTLIELNDQNAKVLRSKGFQVKECDFLQFGGDKVDRIVMNPPFTKQQDIDHILHAFSLLKDGGVLVSIVSESPFFRENKKSQQFREFLYLNDAEVIENDEGAFRSSGTMVGTRIIKLVN